ncbi:PD-(D/E)XK nuclease family protein [Lewinella sp. 4G2]|uniref:PD-(D/E)XK nuclease family protein n=1 Tax=Lewinella sp. 4G2 TaxID=1803372 RepID=UPI0007B4BA07|nr:PD-(D/E)XK nuclease family protein [Lewinella sp. 4G2]OAV45059.1 hypothetical protein A3850_011425 [Lewinella sp. 4G2]
MNAELKRDKYWEKWISVRSPELHGDRIASYKEVFYRYERVISAIDGRTFYDILGYSHYENMATNVLAYLFDDNEDHGLAGLFVKSWLEVNQLKNPHNYGVNRIEREYVLPDGKRIDLLVEFNDQIWIIENKIYAAAYNDLDSYCSQIEGIYSKNERKVSVFLLSMFDQRLPDCSYDLKLVTYKSFVDCIENNLGNYILHANQSRLPAILEFLKSL